jgi:hypothetical protein
LHNNNKNGNFEIIVQLIITQKKYHEKKYSSWKLENELRFTANDRPY